MKKSILFAGLLLAVFATSKAAYADGFKCVDSTGVYGVKVYNNAHSELGTRTPAVLILSSGAEENGSRTLATLTPDQNGLRLDGAVFAAELNFPAAYSAVFGGVKMSQINKVRVLINHTFNAPLKAGQKVSGYISIFQKNNTFKELKIVCERYLKN